MHVHVGVDDADKAVHVANGMRVHLPVLLALSANSPFWRADALGPDVDAHADLPRVPARGHPARVPRLGRLRARRSSSWSPVGVMEDYTYLWYDVRPHPQFGTVEIRVCDSQTRVEHTLGLAALIQAMVRELCEHYASGGHFGDYPWQMLDENKWLAARHGLDGELVDLPSSERVATKTLARRLVDRLRGHAEDLGSAADLDGVIDLIERGNGAERQLVVYEANRDFTRAHARDRRGDGLPLTSWRKNPPDRVPVTPKMDVECPTLTSSSSARAAGRRSAPTSPNARTAGHGCASGLRRSSATGACRNHLARRVVGWAGRRRARPRRRA